MDSKRRYTEDQVTRILEQATQAERRVGASFGFNHLTLPRWAEARQLQMDGVAA